MRAILLSFMFSLIVPSMAQAGQNTADNTAQVVDSEKAFWNAYVSGDTDKLGALFLPDFTSVEQYIWNRSQVLNFVRQFHSHCSLAPVTVIDPHVSFITPDVATIVYHATESPTCGTRSMSGNTNISTVWIRRDGRWQMHLHTEYAIPPQ